MQAPPPPARRGSLADRPAGAAGPPAPSLIPPPRPEMLIALQPSIWSRTPIPHKTVMGRAAGLLAVRTGGQQGGSLGTSVAPGRAQSALLPPPLTWPPACSAQLRRLGYPAHLGPRDRCAPHCPCPFRLPPGRGTLGTRQWAGTGVSAPQAGSSSISVASLEAQAVPAARVTVWQEGPAGGHPLARPASGPQGAASHPPQTLAPRSPPAYPSASPFSLPSLPGIPAPFSSCQTFHQLARHPLPGGRLG